MFKKSQNTRFNNSRYLMDKFNFQMDYNFLKNIITKHPDILYLLPKAHVKEYLFDYITNNETVLNYEKNKKNPYILVASIAKDKNITLDNEIFNNKEVMKIAITQNNKCLECLGTTLQEDKEFLAELVVNNKLFDKIKSTFYHYSQNNKKRSYFL
jgi:hypothetical protein